MDRARFKSAAAPLAITLAAAVAALLPAPARKSNPREVTTQAPRDAPPATTEAIALLDGLRPGDTLGVFRVVRIRGPRERLIAVDLENDGLELTLTVALHGALPHSAPQSTARYDLFYDPPRPPGRALAFEAIKPVLAALAERIARVEERTPTPPGM